MADPLDNANEVLEELKGAALHTSQGSFVRIEHVERLLKRRQEEKEAAAIERVEEGPPPKTLEEARRKAAALLKDNFPSKGPREPGKHVDAA